MRVRHKNKALAAVAVGALMITQGPANAEDTAAEIRELKARLKQLEAKVSDQAKKEKELAKDVAARRMYAAPGAPPLVCKDGPCAPPPLPPPVWVSFGNGLSVESYEKDFGFKIGGRLHVDGGVLDSPTLGDSGNAGIRRARISVEGKAFKYWLYKFDYDFTGTGVTGIRDAYLAFKHPFFSVVPFTSEPLVFQVGNFKEPMGLEQITSSNNITFIERALASDALAPDRHIGAAVGTHGKDWSAKVGIFSTSPQDSATSPIAGNYAFPAGQVAPGIPVPGAVPVSTGGGQYFDITGRLTWAPVHEKDALIHLGASGRYHQPNSATGASDNRVMFLGSTTRVEANILGENLLGTPDLSCGAVFTGVRAYSAKCTSNVVTWGAELVATWGPFSFQGEYFNTHYNRNAGAIAFAAANGGQAYATGGTSLDFSGFYVYGSWFVTGESRAESYNVGDIASALFGSIKILNPVSKGGWGAWELATRYSQLNLNDGGILGGREDDVTVGLNWYPEKGFRLMANWIGVVGNSAPLNNSGTAAPSPSRPYLAGVRPNIFLMRAQVNW